MGRGMLGLVVCAVLATTSACGGGGGHAFVDEDGNEVEIYLGLWVAADSQTGASLDDTFVIGDIGCSYSISGANESISFSYTYAGKSELPNGMWFNEIDLVVKESDRPEFVVGDPYFASVFVWSTGDAMNVVIDDSPPYPTEGQPNPSIIMPMFRFFREYSSF